MKKVLSLIIALVLLFNTIPILGAPSEDKLYEESGEILKGLGVLTGSDSGDLMLDEHLKRQDMVILVSRLYGEEDDAKKHPVKDIFNDIGNEFYKPYIYWAVDQGLIQGTAPNTFGYTTDGNTKYYTKVQQLQAILLRALGYGSEVNESYDGVPKLAEKLGIMDEITADRNDFVTRGQMAAMTLNALKSNIKGYTKFTLADKLNLKIPVSIKVDANPLIFANTLVFEGVAQGTDELKLNLKSLSDDTSFKERFYNIDLEEDGRFEITIDNLEGGKYEYRFTKGNLTLKSGTVEIEDLPFELSDVTANNLKEISLHFTQPVDEETSQFTSKYFTNAGAIKSVRFEDSNKTVILVLDTTMKNESTYNISISKIKSVNGEELNIYNRQFKAFDNDHPEALEVVQLGNKGLKIIASEPVKTPRISDFKIDGSTVRGQVTANDNIIILKYYSTYYAPDEGDHTLNISGLVDFANFRAVDKDLDFSIVEDDAPPKVLNATSNTEEVIITFDEDIDPDSITRTNFYWRAGSSKRYAKDALVSENKLILDFSSNKLPTYEVTLFLDRVEDYSGNTLRDEEIEIEPVVDTAPPEVVGLNVSQDGKSITVHFSKNVKGSNRKNYDIRDEENNRISIGTIQGSGREYKINLGKPLPAGTNIITIEDIVDNTALENRMIPYKQEIHMKDVEVPKILSYSGKDNMILLKFSKEMDLNTVFDSENYIIKFNNQDTYLPEETDFTPLEDEKTIIINLPEEINDKKVDIGRSGNLTEISIQRLKGINGMVMDPTTLKLESETDGRASIKSAELVEPDVIVVTFDQPIIRASSRDFSIPGKDIDDVEVDLTEKVILYLDDDYDTYIEDKLTINSSNRIETYLGVGAKRESIDILDRVAPRIDSRSGTLSSSGRYIYLPFTEELKKEVASLFKEDLIVEALGEGILDSSEYTTSIVDESEIRISVDPDIDAPDGFIVRLVDEPKYIMDESGNIVEYDGYEYYTD